MTVVVAGKLVVICSFVSASLSIIPPKLFSARSPFPSENFSFSTATPVVAGVPASVDPVPVGPSPVEFGVLLTTPESGAAAVLDVLVVEVLSALELLALVVDVVVENSVSKD